MARRRSRPELRFAGVARQQARSGDFDLIAESLVGKARPQGGAET